MISNYKNPITNFPSFGVRTITNYKRQCGLILRITNHKDIMLHAHLGWGIDFKEHQAIIVEHVDKIEKRTKFVR